VKARWVASILALLTPHFVWAQVHTELVSADASVQPGHPLNLALRLAHEPPWHTFWRNAGIGYPTAITWSLPPGWPDGQLQWPTPTLIKDQQGAITGQGYAGLVYLPITLKAPVSAIPGQQVALRATVKWLMCAQVCVPGSADVVLTLPIMAGAPLPNGAVRTELTRMPMPASAQDWKMAASSASGTVTFTIGTATAVANPHFFPQNAVIPYDQRQEAIAKPGLVQLTLPASDHELTTSPRLIGVLAYSDASGTYRGVSVDIPISKTIPNTEPKLTAALLALAFAGGLILNLMPCVFPVLAIKIFGFVNQAGNSRRRVLGHGLAYSAGVLVSFWALAGLLVVLRTGGQRLGWGFQLQSAPFIFVLAALMTVFALSLSGVFEFGASVTGAGSSLQTRAGFSGSFFTGVLATVVATPCSAPFLAPALGAALTLSAAPSLVVFTLIALGLSSPYLLLSAFPQALDLLPGPGRWMETFRQFLAFPLYATAGYLIWVLAGETGEYQVLDSLLALTLIAMAVWVYGRFTSSSKARARVLGSATAVVLLVLGLVLGWPLPANSDDLKWEPWSTERVATLRQEQRLVYVDFTARWCATCQANRKLVFGSEAVRNYVRTHRVALLEADWTNSDPRITRELAKWNRGAVPFDLLYRPSASEPEVLPELLTPQVVLRLLAAAPAH
jgi:thiol:disulfide interchange protein